MTLGLAPETIELWPLERLQPYAKNAKLHGEDQVAKIAASIAEFGWTVPVLVGEDGEVIAGHGRILAAQKLGLSEAPVIVLGHLTEDQRRAYRIADNRLAESGWDDALLSAELKDLLADEFDLSLIGFSDGELDKLLAAVPDEDGEEGGGSVTARYRRSRSPEPPRNPASRTGDLWILGDHRLLCGDSTSAADVRRLMNGERAALFATDPPYLVDYDGSNHPTRNKDWSASYGTTWDDSSQGAELTTASSAPRSRKRSRRTPPGTAGLFTAAEVGAPHRREGSSSSPTANATTWPTRAPARGRVRVAATGRR